MPAGPRPQPPDRSHRTVERCPDVAAYETQPGEMVFVEADNPNGWIASDRIVTTRR